MDDLLRPRISPTGRRLRGVGQSSMAGWSNLAVRPGGKGLRRVVLEQKWWGVLLPFFSSALVTVVSSVSLLAAGVGRSREGRVDEEGACRRPATPCVRGQGPPGLVRGTRVPEVSQFLLQC